MGIPVEAGPRVPDVVVDRLEHHVRRLGIPLAAAETLVEDLETAEGFLTACEAGRGRAFAARCREPGADEPEDPTYRVRVTADPPGRGSLRRDDPGAAAQQA